LIHWLKEEYVGLKDKWTKGFAGASLPLLAREGKRARHYVPKWLTASLASLFDTLDAKAVSLADTEFDQSQRDS